MASGDESGSDPSSFVGILDDVERNPEQHLYVQPSVTFYTSSNGDHVQSINVTASDNDNADLTLLQFAAEFDLTGLCIAEQEDIDQFERLFTIPGTFEDIELVENRQFIESIDLDQLLFPDPEDVVTAALQVPLPDSLLHNAGARGLYERLTRGSMIQMSDTSMDYTAMGSGMGPVSVGTVSGTSLPPSAMPTMHEHHHLVAHQLVGQGIPLHPSVIGAYAGGHPVSNAEYCFQPAMMWNPYGQGHMFTSIPPPIPPPTTQSISHISYPQPMIEATSTGGQSSSIPVSKPPQQPQRAIKTPKPTKKRNIRKKVKFLEPTDGLFQLLLTVASHHPSHSLEYIDSGLRGIAKGLLGLGVKEEDLERIVEECQRDVERRYREVGVEEVGEDEVEKRQRREGKRPV
ncbi:uncharacterized protein SPPG_04364 [Spizellomyces punctatus DAOM BR117]|uniref:Uncharacterized protein n=1 Tax=Spizellomyces punctatus (strain DAOM BR117) TaxID=645134 RepID=A0A0L0HG21_SPIPD|nr:uncharacterized protein SPPG_04364 [Spizellomyces punctatus DAOM BR117]KND00018.1 hypothetical protein SPPG_04364 [Spizellomyces punctatus DAOM BR117]|eukprot:XP_016608057.1 hypothetical protein SPPG_04364 [Spizellomyces punctatus DAOM BR117]